MMKVKETSHRYIEWISPGDMHSETVQWLSELRFVKDEQLFLNNLVKHYTTILADSDIFPKSRDIVGEILDAEKEVEQMIKKVQLHENQLEILIDDVDQPKMEQAYKETHKDLLFSMRNYMERYKELKKKLFGLITSLVKKDKQKRLLN